MLNPSSAEFTLHATHTLQKSSSAVDAFHCIGSYIAESYFCCFWICVACVCCKIPLLLFYIFMALYNLSFADFELQIRQNRDGMPSPVHFFDQQTCIWYKNGRQQTFTVTAVLPRQPVFCQLGGSRQKETTSDTRGEGQKRDILSDTLSY